MTDQTAQTAKIAALQTLNARLLQDNVRLAKDNEELRAQLSARPAQGSPARERDVRNRDARPDPVATTRETAGSGVVHVAAGVSLFDRLPAERRFLVGEAHTRETDARSTRSSLPIQAPLRRIAAGGVPVRRTPPPASTPVTPANPPRVRDDAATRPPSQTQDRPQVRPLDAPRPRPRTQEQDDARRTPASAHEDDASARFSLLELD